MKFFFKNRVDKFFCKTIKDCFRQYCPLSCSSNKQNISHCLEFSNKENYSVELDVTNEKMICLLIESKLFNDI